MPADDQRSIDERIWQVVAAIPKGQVMSYGAVARAAGLPRAPRRVSPALNRAPKKLKLQWQRVVGANGRIAFPVDSSAYRRQRKLLEQEGVEFKGKHIAGSYLQTMGRSGGDLDAQLWDMQK